MRKFFIKILLMLLLLFAIFGVFYVNAQKVADALVSGGVKGIWNFAPIDLAIPEGIALESVHLSDSLHALSFMIKSMNEGRD